MTWLKCTFSEQCVSEHLLILPTPAKASSPEENHLEPPSLGISHFNDFHYTL